MKQKNLLLYVIGAAAVAYLIFRKKPTAPAANVLQKAKETANEILTTVETMPKALEMPPAPVEFLPAPPAPIKITDAEVGPGPQLSPTPASILSPDQLIKFNQNIEKPKGMLMGVC